MSNDTSKFRCGRRPPYDPDSPLVLDMPGDPTPDTYRHDGHCSYCGSVSQDRFFDFVKKGGELGPTDKSYKVYLHDTPSVQAPGLKFYFQHLDQAGQKEFVLLNNARKIAWGYPGQLYVTPYFCTVEEPRQL